MVKKKSRSDSKLVESSKLAFDAFIQCKMEIIDNDFIDKHVEII